MTRLLLFLIARATPPVDREWVLGDTIEEFQTRNTSDGAPAARRWLRRETLRVLASAPRHRYAVRTPVRADDVTSGEKVMAPIAQDFRYALRLLRRAPGFAVVAVATLALGIGANAAMFAVVNGLLLKPLPFRDPDRLMLVHLTAPDIEQPGTYREMVWSVPKYRTFGAAQTAFEQMAMFAGRDISLSGDGEPERVRGEVVTEHYPGVLGTQPLLGRSFTAAEAEHPGMSPAAMIGHGLWSRRFGGDPGVLGRPIDVNGTRYTIVGVLPRGFQGLSGDAQIWVPLGTFEPTQLTEEQSHSYYTVARRRPEVSEASAKAVVHQLGEAVDAAHRGGVGRAWGASAASLYASRADIDVRRAAIVLLGAVACVLLIACVNLTNLIGARASARRREVGVRVAIGASRGRIVRQFLAEGTVLAAAGAIAGVLVAALLLAAVARLLPDPETFFRTAVTPGTPRVAGASGLTRIGASMIGLDGTTLAFTCVIALAAAILISLLPAAQASMLRPVDALKSGAQGLTPRGRHRSGARNVLVTSQIALALILMCGAGLMIRSAARLQATDIGVRTDSILTVRLDLPRASYSPEQGTVFLSQLVDRVRALPGVSSAGLANCPPVSGGCNGTSFWEPSRGRLGPGQDPLVGIHWATPEYFPTLGIGIKRGRNFTDRDRRGQPRIVLVNDTAARTLWPNDDPIGKRVALGQGGFHEGAVVVGVVSDVRYQALESAARPDFYVPVWQSYQPRLRLFVRAEADPRTLVASIRREVRALDPALPLSEVKTLADRVGDAMWRTRVVAWVFSGFAAMALLLTAIGVFGVMAQTVVQRTSEIGIRMALGAGRRDVLLLMLRQAALLTAAGVVIGVAAALVLTRVIASFLHDVTPRDPLTFIAVGLILGCVALLACYIPARRATAVDAIVALRD
jgi:predicted permease